MDQTAAYQFLRDDLLKEIRAGGCVRGELSSSALSSAVAAFALHAGESVGAAERVPRAVGWLLANGNADGGWGDTVRSPSNLSTTLLVRSALARFGGPDAAMACERADSWLADVAGSTSPESIVQAVLGHYGKDRTFSIPILTMAALGGLLGPPDQAWRRVPQLPFELAAFPHGFYRFLGLPVVSYALPALIAMGLVRHRLGPGGLLRPVRSALTRRVLDKLTGLQPENGGFLEASPLTGFVALSLSSCGLSDHVVVRRALQFLEAGQRADGSWAIDSDLATWITTLAVKGMARDMPEDARCMVREWLLGQQFVERHPFTNSPPGGWGWTDLPGSVPDADDTAGALLALRCLGGIDDRVRRSAIRGVDWLLGLANRDGGTPTFCRGWGKLPFDESSPDLTIHALQAYAVWLPDLPEPMRLRVRTAIEQGLRYLAARQGDDGSWVPLWFGNDGVPGHRNPVYGTARVVLGLREVAGMGYAVAPDMLSKGARFLVQQQSPEGGWGGAAGASPSVEETALAVCALRGGEGHDEVLARGMAWLCASLNRPVTPRPIGLYFASLWYFEKRYPDVFALAALRP